MTYVVKRLVNIMNIHFYLKGLSLLEYSLPIAATWVEGEPCDLIRVGGFTLCKECRSKIYKVVESILPKDKIKELNKKALDIKMGRYDE